MKKPETNWRWGTPEGGREFDRLMDARLSFREKIQWIEETEALHERLAEKTAGCFDKDKGDQDSRNGERALNWQIIPVENSASPEMQN